MDTIIDVIPEMISAYGQAPGGDFVLVTNNIHKGKFRFPERKDSLYKNKKIIYINESQEFVDALKNDIEDKAHILTVLTECLVHSVSRNELGNRKLLIMACRSGKTDIDGVKHFLECGYATDVQNVQDISNRFFDNASESSFLNLKDRKYNTQAKFVHTSDEYDWHEQCGFLEPGDQQVFPSGEIACFLVPLYTDKLPERRFNLSGELVISGPSIVQSGPPSFQISDQERIYQALFTANEGGVKINIDNGVIVSHEAVNQESKLAEQMLSNLFMVDSRYRNIYEVGFSINPYISLWKGNSAMNEIWGEDGGKLHLGLGMLPYTQYHIDTFCQHTYVELDSGDLLFGKKVNMTRKKSAVCPCTAI